MAIFNNNSTHKCTCGNDTFTEVEVFRIIEKPIKQTLTGTTALVKEVIGNKIQCTECKTIIDNPLNK